MGRCGSIVYNMLKGMGVEDIYTNDVSVPATDVDSYYDKEYTWIESVFENCDIITLHIPLVDKNIDNTNFIGEKELNMMKPNVRLLNMSRVES